MKIIQKIVQITITILLVSSCAKLPLHQSKRVEDVPIATNNRYYDIKGKISYDIYNDDQNIHLHIAASDYATQVKILKLGFTIWMDQKGKKNEDKGIIFPQKQVGNSSFKQEGGRPTRQMNMNSQDKEKKQMTQLHMQYQLSPKNMTLIGMEGEDSKRVVNADLDKSDIKTSIYFDTLNDLHYQVIIPIDKIFTEEKYNDSIFSIGLESGFIEMNYGGSSQGGSVRGGKGSGGGMRGGGMPGSGKGGGHSGGNGAGNSGQRSTLSEPVKIWFKVSLKPIVD